MSSILIVEDEEEARKHLVRTIERHGFEVHSASTGAEAVAVYGEKRPDVVLLDMLLPDIDGDEVLKRFFELDPAASVYFMTGYEDVMTEEKAKTLGARGLFTKPLIFEKIKVILVTLQIELQMQKKGRQLQ